MKKKFSNAVHFFQIDLWKKTDNPKKPIRSFFYKMLRIIVSTFSGFLEDDCFSKASALTFYMLLSIVPIIAIGFGIAQNVGLEEKFQDLIQSALKDQPLIASKIIGFAKLDLEQTKGGIIAALGIFVLLWSVLNLISYIENYFDEIWKTTHFRTLWQQFVRYIPLIIIFPIFLVGLTSLMFYISALAVASTQHIEVFSPIILSSTKLIPFVISWLILSFLYIYLPNTEVHWKYGFIGGFIAAILYQLWQWVYITFQAHASSYGIIYGSFAAIPLFLIWLNYSWLIILFGSEVAYHIQEEQSKARELPDKIIGSKRLIAIAIVDYCYRHYFQSKKPIVLSELSSYLGISKKTTQLVCNDLVQSKILQKKDIAKDDAFEFQNNQESVDLASVFIAVNRSKDSIIPMLKHQRIEELKELEEQFEDEFFSNTYNRKFKDIAHKI